MDAQEAATVLFPSLARPLQKYLRTTRQHLHYSLANTTSHLSECFEHGLSHRAFLQRYLRPRPSLSYNTNAGVNDTLDYEGELSEWRLSSDKALTENIVENTYFSLTSTDFSLCITIYKHPRIQITEAIPDKVKFSLKV